MGLVARVLSFLQTSRHNARVSDVKVDPGGGPNITAEHFTGVGDDSNPLTTDYAALIELPQTGRAAAVGYLDPLNTPVAQPGEKRIYARDADTGEVIVELWLKNDGTATLLNAGGSFELKLDGSVKGTNSNGSFELQAGGDFVVNGATIDITGQITSPVAMVAPSMVANSKELAGHTHAINSGSSAPGPTGPNN